METTTTLRPSASPPAAMVQPAAAVVETVDLTKAYERRRVAVDRLRLSIRQGEVYGLLGPNGAGKTTTLRMLLGLVRPTSGGGTVLGLPLGSQAALARVGALIETPAFYPHLSGRANLEALAMLAGVARERVDLVLRQVDLLDRADDRFASYSLGMKQRLGVAEALLKDPQLLVLDEPTNGLDPQGRVDMRELLRGLGHDSRTVIVSSHLLEDVEQVCDRVGVLNNGRLIAEKTIGEIRGPSSVLVRARPIERALRLLADRYPSDRIARSDGALVIAADPGRAGDIANGLVHAGVELLELRPVQRSLEDAFLELTGSAGGAVEV